MRIAFLGTPEFALPSLSALHGRGYELCVITQPDRPVGRKAVLTPSAVKSLALELSLPVLCFEKLRSKEGVTALSEFAPDLVVTCAFGQFLSKACLAIPRLGTVNVHASLLPKFRGASPIQSAVIAGEAETGVSTMLTELGMDTGPILLQSRTAIEPNETYGELSQRLSHMGAALLLETIDALVAGHLTPTPQNDALATVCHMLGREDGKLDFTQTAGTVHNLIRGTQPWPQAYALLDGQVLKLLASKHTTLSPNDDACPGSLVCVGKNTLLVRCGDGWLELLRLQLAGGKPLSAADFMRGKPLNGKVLI